MYNIMLIEDDKKLNILIRNHLKKYRYQTCCVNDFCDIKTEFIKK